MINMHQISDNLELGENGIWFSKGNVNVSYPEEGSSLCFEIEEKSFWFKHRNSCIIQAIKNAAPSRPIFDIGGGNGFVAKALCDLGIETVLVEPGVNAALNEKKRGVQTVVCSSFENANFQNCSIGAIGIFDVLEHLQNDEEFLKIIYNGLVNEGKLFITVPAFNCLWSSEDVFAQHFRRYTIDGLKTILFNNGFRIDFASYIFSWLPIPIFVFRSFLWMIGLRKRGGSAKINSKEHRSPSGIIGFLFEKIALIELWSISKGKKIPWGSSCLIVAQKDKRLVKNARSTETNGHLAF